MVKEYRLFYAIKSANLDETARYIAKLLGMDVKLRTGSSGDYATCEGAAADRLYIRPRNRNDFPRGIDYKPYDVQLTAINATGKNSEKEVRHNNLKSKLGKLSGFLLVTETVVES
ncbi:hypothetical protein GCM10023185_05980 [Hymenobacter saemangeumensis]|uniref:Uncharacterized protein n=1 Tax=Hymenobacter saemangeumensis TaxID=1084522 RepID=A0ABP8I1A3_9BACT